MDLLKLDANRQGNTPIEGYDSLIWTERFLTAGDFQLVTGDIGKGLTLMPEGTLLSLRESNIVMKVETREIERKKNAPHKLTIRGRSWETVLEQRVAVKALSDTTDWIVNLKTPSDLAWFVINQICVAGLADAADIFPGSVLQFPAPADYNTSTGPVKALAVTRGNLYSTVLTLLQTELPEDATTSPVTPAVIPHGLRAVRPNGTGTAVAIEIYTGSDKTQSVYFDATRALLDDGKYLFSKVGSADAAYIVGPGVSAKMNKYAVPKTGLERRVILVDAGTSGITDLTTLRNQGSLSLSEARETAMFDGSINQDISPYIYGVDYKLGDVVKLVGDYGLPEQKARVTEYIRSADSTGNKAYPALTTVPT